MPSPRLPTSTHPAFAVLRARVRRREQWASAAVVVAISLLALAIWLRQPLSDWLWPDTRIQQLRAEAEQALRAGRLSAPEGRGARELYEAAIALDPDRPEARAGLARVGAAALAEAERAIAADRFEHARRHLDLAIALSMPRARTDAAAAALRTRQAAVADLPRVLARAEAARERSEWAQAARLYGQVIALAPRHVGALEGREDALAALLAQARADIQAGRVADAMQAVQAVQQIDAGHVELADTLSAIAAARESALRGARRDLRAGRLDDAQVGFERVLAFGGQDTEARQGLEQVGLAHAARSREAAADFRFDAATRALDRAEALAPNRAEVTQAREALARARSTQSRLVPRPTRAARRSLDTLLREAAQAQARGDLLEPPGDSAYDKLRAARALAPNDARVSAALRRLQPAARSCFEDHLRANRLSGASDCLDTWQALAGRTPATRAASARLAQRWIAVGDERLGAGELDAARRALANARTLDPAAAGLADLAERVRVAAALERD